MTLDLLPVRRALLSVSDKTGLEEFAKGLHEFGVELISTGGTAAFLQPSPGSVVQSSLTTALSAAEGPLLVTTML